MRRVLAWVLLLAGLGCGIAGALLLTVFAPPQRITALETSSDPGVAVVSGPGLLDLTGPAATVSASLDGTGGDADVFIGIARADDVAAWLADAAHTEVTGITGDVDAVRTTSATAGSGPAADPRSSDIWITSAQGRGGAELTWPIGPQGDLAGGGGVVALAATDGAAAAPRRVSFSWSAEGDAARHPSAVPLAVVGGALVVLGGLGVLLTPRGPRSHPRPRPRREEAA